MKRSLKRKLIDTLKSVYLRRYYGLIKKGTYVKHDVVCRLDGRIKHGGLSDRFYGIISAYKFCKDNNKRFGLLYTSPFDLQEFLVPNRYNWKVEESDVLHNIRDVFPIYISIVYKDRNMMREYFTRKLSGKTGRQVHLYSNAKIYDDAEFSLLFNELFNPSPRLSKKLEALKSKHKEGYVSVTFRFQKLLGDFNEGNYPVIDDKQERERLITLCLRVVADVSGRHQGSEVLVTSDSISFLEIVSQVPGVFIIPGTLAHIDYVAPDEFSLDVYEKSFLDLFMIASASKVYDVRDYPLYSGGFAYTASLIGGKPFEELRLQ